MDQGRDSASVPHKHLQLGGVSEAPLLVVQDNGLANHRELFLARWSTVVEEAGHE
jgi:hypothetical protein